MPTPTALLLCALLLLAAAEHVSAASYYTTLVSIPANVTTKPQPGGYTYLPSSVLLNTAVVGAPCTIPSGASGCQTVDNTKLNALLVKARIGPKTRISSCLTGMSPALYQLRRALKNVRNANPDLYSRIGTAGMLCCRYIAGTTTYSNHAWGSAIDITMEDVLDPYNDKKVQQGLLDLWPYMNSLGFYWGAGFTSEDGMHFEVSQQIMSDWINGAGLAGQPKPWNAPAASDAITSGCTWPSVTQWSSGQAASNISLAAQYMLEYNCHSAGTPDGKFGSNSMTAAANFRLARQITEAAGVAIGPATWRALFDDQRYGDDSDMVTAIRVLLNRVHGYKSLSDTGRLFDLPMNATVVAFQLRKGTSRRDGVVDLETFQALVCNCNGNGAPATHVPEVTVLPGGASSAAPEASTSPTIGVDTADSGAEGAGFENAGSRLPADASLALVLVGLSFICSAFL